MPVRITTGQSNIAVAYRFDFPDGYQFKVVAIPLDTRTAREVLGNVTEDYAVIVPLHPPGYAFPFLIGMQQRPDYVMTNTGLRGKPATLLTALLPVLTAIPPVDDLAPIADAWFASL